MNRAGAHPLSSVRSTRTLTQVPWCWRTSTTVPMRTWSWTSLRIDGDARSFRTSACTMRTDVGAAWASAANASRRPQSHHSPSHIHTRDEERGGGVGGGSGI